MKWLTALLALCFAITFPSFATTYYLSPTGNDLNSGTSTGTPWQTPNHALNCGDVIQAAASTAYNGSLFSESHWGTVSGCSSSNEFAYLNCISFDACKISGSGNFTGIWVDKSNWAVEGWEVTVSGSTNTACFQATPNTSTLTSIHHILFANNVANGCDAAGFSTYNQGSAASVDYIAIVGNIAYNAAQGSNQCGSGISVYQPIAYDSASGTHIYIAGNFSYANTNVNPCGGTAPTDGEGIILDTFDGSQGGLASPYCQQAVVQNNIVFYNGGKGLYVYNNQAGSCHAPIYFKYNTAYGDLLDNNQIYCLLNGDLTSVTASDVSDSYNLVQTNSATGCGGNAKYGFSISGGDSTDTFNNNYVSGVSGNNTSIYNSSGFSLGSGNTIGTNPTFSNPVNPGAPSCGSSANTVACMSSVISDYTPTVSAATSYGYQMPRTSSAYDPLYPQWLCSATLPAGIVTQGCGASTWYVRPAGGTRYSTNVTAGQCNGLADADYPGSGTNQACAFNDVRYLFQDGTYNTGPGGAYPAYGWIGSSGDTYLIRGSIGTGASYRIGWNNPNSATSGSVYWGVPGNNALGMPPPINGTSAAHTKILGENYASCHTQSSKTQIHGGYGVYGILDLRGSSYVDVACIDFTDWSDCGRASQTNLCNTGIGTLSDFATNGVMFSNTSTNLTLTDIDAHGLGSGGFYGPTGGNVTMNYITIAGSPFSDWSTDDGTVGVGSLNVTNFSFTWSGCAEEYPIVDAVPYQDCTDDNSGGYGDAWGTASIVSTTPWNIHFDQGVVAYNTQDGLDALHLTGGGTSVTVTRVLAYGNMGQQIKVGGAGGTIINNLIVGNCNALRQAIPGVPSGYNSNLSDFCRAADVAIAVAVQDGSTLTIQDNTILAANATTFEIDCSAGSAGTCSSSYYMDFRNNIFLGFQKSSLTGYPGVTPPGAYSNPYEWSTAADPLTLSGSTFANNITYHYNTLDWSCPGSTEVNALCVDPGLVDETWHNYGYGNMALATGSPAIHSGVAISGITTDYAGVTRPNPPSRGALEYVSAGSGNAGVAGSVKLSGAVSVQ